MFSIESVVPRSGRPYLLPTPYIRDDLNIDTDSIKELINSKTKAIMPVHYTGKMCNMADIMKIADEYGLAVIEDAAQSFGGKYKNKVPFEFIIVVQFRDIVIFF